MALNFTQKRGTANRPELRRITSWVEDALPESMDDVMVMVNELQCFEPVGARTPTSSFRHARSLPTTDRPCLSTLASRVATLAHLLLTAAAMHSLTPFAGLCSSGDGRELTRRNVGRVQDLQTRRARDTG